MAPDSFDRSLKRLSAGAADLSARGQSAWKLSLILVTWTSYQDPAHASVIRFAFPIFTAFADSAHRVATSVIHSGSGRKRDWIPGDFSSNQVSTVAAGTQRLSIMRRPILTLPQSQKRHAEAAVHRSAVPGFDTEWPKASVKHSDVAMHQVIISCRPSAIASSP